MGVLWLIKAFPLNPLCFSSCTISAPFHAGLSHAYRRTENSLQHLLSADEIGGQLWPHVKVTRDHARISMDSRHELYFEIYQQTPHFFNILSLSRKYSQWQQCALNYLGLHAVIFASNTYSSRAHGHSQDCINTEVKKSEGQSYFANISSEWMSEWMLSVTFYV